MNRIFAIGTCCLLLVASSLCAQDAAPTDETTSNSIVRTLESEIASLTAAYEQKVTSLDAAYVEKIKALREGAAIRLKELQNVVAPLDLDQAIKLRDLAKNIQDAPLAPPSKVSAEKAASGTVFGRAAKAKQKELLAQIDELEKQLGLQSELSKKVVGKSYSMRFEGGGSGIWTFATSGTLLRDGKATATRWSTFGNDAVICVGYDRGVVDLCQFANDFRNIEVIFVGDYKKSQTHHVGSIVTY